MKKIYVIGKVKGINNRETVKNLNKIIDVCTTLSESGYAVYFPFTEVLNHLNNNTYGPIKKDDSAIEWLKVSDGVLLVNDWSVSDNCMTQITIAEKNNIPVFMNIPEVINHFELTEETPIVVEEKYPSKVFVKISGVLGLETGDCLELNKEYDRYEFKSEIKTKDGMYEKRTTAISTSLYDRNKDYFTV